MSRNHKTTGKDRSVGSALHSGIYQQPDSQLIDIAPERCVQGKEIIITFNGHDKKPNKNKARYDLQVVHKVPSERVQFRARTDHLATISEHTKRRPKGSGFHSFASNSAEFHSKCLYYKQRKGKYNKRVSVQQQEGLIIPLMRNDSLTLPRMWYSTRNYC